MTQQNVPTQQLRIFARPRRRRFIIGSVAGLIALAVVLAAICTPGQPEVGWKNNLADAQVGPGAGIGSGSAPAAPAPAVNSLVILDPGDTHTCTVAGQEVKCNTPPVDDDADDDGIKDVDDKCPNEPETMNDYKDDDGCPDKTLEERLDLHAEILRKHNLRLNSLERWRRDSSRGSASEPSPPPAVPTVATKPQRNIQDTDVIVVTPGQLETLIKKGVIKQGTLR